MKRPYCVALTGGIGSGKTTVANLFAKLGAAIVDTDVISRELSGVGGEAMPAIIEAFGPVVTCADGALDRAVMRELAFANEQVRIRLEAILHPMIRLEVERRLAVFNDCYAILVVPLLVEHLDQYRAFIDRILVVDCDEEQQVTRAASRAGMDEQRVHSVVAAQTPRAKRLAAADDVIDNSSDLRGLEECVGVLHAAYLRQSEHGR